MAKNKRPAFQIYPKDWFADPDVMLMTPAEEGGYWRLLLIEWLEPDCGLPDDDETLAVLSRLGDQWHEGSGAKIRKKFRAEDGRLFNDRLLEEWGSYTQRKKKESTDGKIAAEIRWAKEKDAKRMRSVSEPHGDRITDLGALGNAIASSSKTPRRARKYDPKPGWNCFIQEWPQEHITGLDQAGRNWISLVENKETECEVLEGLSRWKASDQWARGIIHDMAKWLAASRWKDHPAKAGPKKGRTESAFAGAAERLKGTK